jgi:hypothetical protein
MAAWNFSFNSGLPVILDVLHRALLLKLNVQPLTDDAFNEFLCEGVVLVVPSSTPELAGLQGGGKNLRLFLLAP